MNTKITISGPGSVINNELFIIQKALEAYGYTVEVVNEHPAEGTEEAMQSHLDRLKNNKAFGSIEIVMDHQPWGG